jgi:hypothetical protein
MTDYSIKILNSICLRLSIRLSNKLQDLSLAVSERLGYDVVADICKGGEIEFRRILEDGVPDANSCILIEDVLTKKGGIK